MLAKFWLTPVALASSTRFPPQELRKLQQLVVQNRDTFLDAWNGYFYFECNYGSLEVPLDKLFGTFHDGTPEANERIKERRRRLMQRR